MSQATPSYVPDRGDIVRLSLDPQAGREQSGRRPVLVLSPANYNRKSHLVVVCPLTSQEKGYPFEVPIPEGNAVYGVILADQIRSLDWVARNAEYVSEIDEETLAQVTGRSIALIDPDGLFSTPTEE